MYTWCMHAAARMRIIEIIPVSLKSFMKVAAGVVTDYRVGLSGSEIFVWFHPWGPF